MCNTALLHYDAHLSNILPVENGTSCDLDIALIHTVILIVFLLIMLLIFQISYSHYFNLDLQHISAEHIWNCLLETESLMIFIC